MRKNVLVTGSSNGIGFVTANLFARSDFDVYGMDIVPPSGRAYYNHIECDVRKRMEFPILPDISIIINNAGTQCGSDDIGVNLRGVMNVTEAYGLNNLKLKSIVNLASVSAHNGAEFPEYCASKGGVLSYTRWTAKQVAKYGATCNSISFGGVLTQLNDPVIQDTSKWDAVMAETPLKKWVTVEEAAEWIYFIAAINKSMSGQDIIVDNLEMLNHNFIW